MTPFKNLGEKNPKLKYVYWSEPWQMWADVLQNGFFLSWKLPFKEKHLFVIVWFSSQNKSVLDWKDWWRFVWVSRFSVKVQQKKQTYSWENKKPSIFVTRLATKTTLRLCHLSYWLTAWFPPPISNELSHNVRVFDKRTVLVLHSLKDVH